MFRGIIPVLDPFPFISKDSLQGNSIGCTSSCVGNCIHKSELNCFWSQSDRAVIKLHPTITLLPINIKTRDIYLLQYTRINFPPNLYLFAVGSSSGRQLNWNVQGRLNTVAPVKSRRWIFTCAVLFY